MIHTVTGCRLSIYHNPLDIDVLAYPVQYTGETTSITSCMGSWMTHNIQTTTAPLPALLNLIQWPVKQ